VPTSPLALVLFVLLGVPGVVYHRRREAFRPPVAASAFRETAEVVVRSAVYDGVALAAVLGWYAARLPGRLDVGRLVADPTGYLAARAPLVAAWYAAVLLLAAGLAWSHATVDHRGDRHQHRPGSVWLDVFAPARPSNTPGAVLVECFLADDTRVLGLAARYTAEEGREGSRDLALSHALVTDAAGSPVDAEGWVGGYVVLNEKQIRWWRVKYLTEDAATRFRAWAGT
jgi:hypothetical protein